MKFGKRDPDGSYRDAEFEDMPEEIRAEFEAILEAHEKAVPVRLWDVLQNGGYPIADPSNVTDTALRMALGKLFEGLALLNVFVENTDHLTDRELYRFLWKEVLFDEVVIFPSDRRGAFHIDVLGACSEEDMELYLRYYADDEWRARWAADWGDVPPKEKLPFNRDKTLPKPRLHFDEPVKN